MTISVKHTFQSAKGDPADTTLVRPSDWNDEHVITLAADSLLGRSTAGSGAVEEVPCTALGRSLLASADLAAILVALGAGMFTTGDIKPTLKSSADAGWVMCDDGTIGDGSSAASTRANADTEDLFVLLWEGVSDTYAPVTGGRGVSAAADWAAHKKISLTKTLGRALAASGAGSGLTSRALGETDGEETHVLTKAEAPSGQVEVVDGGHRHLLLVNETSLAGSDPPTNVTQVTYGAQIANNAANAFNYSMQKSTTDATVGRSSSATTGITLTDHGSDDAHNNVQPTSFVNFMVKL